jgi:hypothetical protein
MHLQFQVIVHDSKIEVGENPRMSNTGKSSEQMSIFSITYISGGEGGDYIAPFSATLLFSFTSFVKPAFSVV